MRTARYADRWPGNYRAGMWMWLLHRISGVVLVLYGIVHVIVISSARTWGPGTFDRVLDRLGTPLFLALDVLLVWAVLFHAFNGIRCLLLDFGIGVRRHHKALFWAMMAIAVALLVVNIVIWAPYILGKALT